MGHWVNCRVSPKSLLRRNSEQADQWQRRTHELTEQGQVTDRYTKAIEQLGSDKLDVRIGGIYALERIARDSAKDHPTVMEVLTAFIREHSRDTPEPRVRKGQNDRTEGSRGVRTGRVSPWGRTAGRMRRAAVRYRRDLPLPTGSAPRAQEIC